MDISTGYLSFVILVRDKLLEFGAIRRCSNIYVRCKGILKNLLIHKPCPAQFSRDILRNCSEVVYTFRSYLPCLLTITRKETLKSFKLGRRKHLENKAHSCQFSPLFTHCPHLSPISTLFHFFLQFKDSKNYSY